MRTSPTQPTRATSVLARLRALAPHRGLDLAEALTIAERQAGLLLASQPDTSLPVPLRLLTELPRLEIALESDLPASGVSYWTGEVWRLVAHRSELPQRQRFTFFHEYKHVIDYPRRHLFYASGRDRERVADHFAACVLMPRVLLTRAWCSGEQDVVKLADYFAVSPIAMERRLRDLGHLDAPRPRLVACTRGVGLRPTPQGVHP